MLASEPVGGRSQATELICFHLHHIIFWEIYFYIYIWIFLEINYLLPDYLLMFTMNILKMVCALINI